MPVFSDAAGCFLRPLQGLPPGGGDFLIGQFQLFGECARLRPLTRFLSQHQLVQRPETSTSLRKRIYTRTHSARGQKWAGGQQSAVRAVRARAPLRLSFGRNWFHTSYIGVAVAELQAKLRVRHLREDRDTAKDWCPTRFGAANWGVGVPGPLW